MFSQAARDTARSERDEALRGWSETRAAVADLDSRILNLDREKAPELCEDQNLPVDRCSAKFAKVRQWIR